MFCILLLVTLVVSVPVPKDQRSSQSWFPPGENEAKCGPNQPRLDGQIAICNPHHPEGGSCCSLAGYCGSSLEHCCATCPNYHTGKNVVNETDEQSSAAGPGFIVKLSLSICGVLVMMIVVVYLWFRRPVCRSSRNKTGPIQGKTDHDISLEVPRRALEIPHGERQKKRDIQITSSSDTAITSKDLDSANMKLLGRGAQADVLKGVFRGETVAVKKYRTDEKNGNEGYYKLEVETLRKMSHRNLLKYIGHIDDIMCIIVEYCPSSLAECIHKNTFILDWMLFSEWVNHLVEALHYLHQNDIIHRDIKPSNVLVSRDNVLRVCDFGVSRIAAITQCTFVTSTGTPGYDAPEMRRRENYTRKVDVFSFGVLLWEMATRRNPHTELEYSPEEKSASTNKKLPPTLLLMISKCTKMIPTDRPSFVELRKGVLWGVAQSDLRKNEKDWPDSKRDAQLSANGWNYTMDYFLQVENDQTENKSVYNQ